MRNDKDRAIELRKQNKSYNQIARELGMSKSTLSVWFRNLTWSQQITTALNDEADEKQIKLMNQASRLKWEAWRESFRQEAKNDFPKLMQNPLFVAGINLYWGEGDHNIHNGKVKLINTDPHMVEIFSNFLRDIAFVPTEKIICWLILYPDLSEQKCKLFWSKASQVPLSQFRKTQYIKGRHPTRRTVAGMCTLEVYSRGLKEKIFTWIDLFYQQYAGIV